MRPDDADPRAAVARDVRRRRVAYTAALLIGSAASGLLIVHGEVQTPVLTAVRGLALLTGLVLAAGLLARWLSLRTVERSLLALLVVASTALLVNWSLDPAPGDVTLAWVAVLFPLSVLVLGKSAGLRLNLAVLLLFVILAAGALTARALGLGAPSASLGEIVNYLGLHGAVIAMLFALGGRYEALMSARQEALVREHDANTDPLTDLPNRRRLTAALSQAVARAHATGAPLSVAWVDLDHFKRVNDTFGHDAGDRVLSGAATRLREVTRRGDLLGRWGGEELLLVLPDCGLDDALRVAEDCRRALSEQPFEGVGTVTGSLGVATLAAGEERDALLRRADRCLYEAKVAGRDRVVGEATREQGGHPSGWAVPLEP